MPNLRQIVMVDNPEGTNFTKPSPNSTKTLNQLKI